MTRPGLWLAYHVLDFIEYRLHMRWLARVIDRLIWRD